MKAKNSPNLKLLLLLVPIFAVVAISGCTGTTGPTFGNGVTILNWEPTFSSIESGDQVQLRIRVQNQGSMTAEGVTAILSGINIDDWLGETDTKNLADLNPPNRVQNTEGEIAQETFDLVAPPLSLGLPAQYTPQIRVFYHYKTNAIKPITIVNENELRRLQDQGKTLPSGDTQTTAGPLKVNVVTGKFIKARTGGYSSNTFPITIDIQNVGGGVVSTLDHPEDDYLVDINIVEPPGLSIVDCGNFDMHQVQLWKGQTASITCNMHIDQLPFSSQEETVNLILEYNYYIDRSTTITVTGTLEETTY